MPAWQEGSFDALGGIPIGLRVWGAAPDVLARQLPQLRAQVAALEAQLSRYREGSDVHRLNAAAGQPVAIGVHTGAVLSRSLQWARRTAGAFDPTVGPLVAMWKGAARAQRWPDAGLLRRTLAHVGHHRVVMEGEGRVAMNGGAQLDLGGIAKGYIADRLAEALQAGSMPRGRVDVGGDLRLFDGRSGATPFRIGIRHPSGEGVLATLTLPGGGIATSGCYERVAEIAGRRACHVVDPRTGQPVARGRSATVVAADAADADALATALLALGVDEGLQLVESLAGVEAIVAVERGEPSAGDGGAASSMGVWVSSGLRETISLPKSR